MPCKYFKNFGCACSAVTSAVAIFNGFCCLDKFGAADRDNLLLALSRPRFTDAFKMKMWAFLDNSELYLYLCRRQHALWGLFVIS